MACEVCEHCHEPVSHNEAYIMREGCSYHEKCHKCYVCSETDLHDAEVFKGVIFCNSCSQRIFQGCATARRTKTGRRSRDNKTHKRRSHRTQDRRLERRHDADGILELSTLAVSTDSSAGSGSVNKLKKTPPSNKTVVRDKKNINSDITNNLRKSSVEMGMTTEVTQELLKQMNCPVVTEYRKPAQLDKPKTKTEERKKRIECSDLRIAELGKSTEIANMALRNKSELPVIIKSESRVEKDSITLSMFSEESVPVKHWMDRRIGSILKLPYMAFKRKILNQSSLVNVLMDSEVDVTLKERLKGIFHEEINNHQKSGLKRLYSTINRKKIPNKLGWLGIPANTKKPRCNDKRCKHFRTSHSYRCMREKVMRLAGPTVSELAGFRNKVFDILSPGFLRNANNRNNGAILTSQACGNSLPGSTKI